MLMFRMSRKNLTERPCNYKLFAPSRGSKWESLFHAQWTSNQFHTMSACAEFSRVTVYAYLALLFVGVRALQLILKAGLPPERVIQSYCHVRAPLASFFPKPTNLICPACDSNLCGKSQL